MTVLLHPLDGEIIHCAFIRILKIPDGGTSRSVCRSCWFLQAYPRMALPPGPGKRGSDTWCIPYCTPRYLLASPLLCFIVPYTSLSCPGMFFSRVVFRVPTGGKRTDHIIFLLPWEKTKVQTNGCGCSRNPPEHHGCAWGPRIGLQVASGANIRSRRWHTIRVVMTFRRWLTPEDTMERAFHRDYELS